jgi:opacity protein-like surface antigen
MSMKGAIILVMAMLLAVPVMAQDKQISFGVKGGINMANLTYDPEPVNGPDNLMGIAAGGVLSFNLSPSACLDGEVLYIQKGVSSDLQSEFCSGSADLKLTYISISPMLRFKIHAESFTPYFMGGAEFGLLMSAKSTGSSDCEGESEDFDLDVKDYFKGSDLGVTFGAGVEFPMGSSALFVEGRYAMGLTDISDTPEDLMSAAADYENSSTKSKGIYLFGGLRF